MKNVLSKMKFAFLAMFASIAMIAAAPTASAQEVATYGNNCGNQCNPTPPPPPSSSFEFSIFGGAAFQGVGAGVFTGQEGGVLVEKTGGSGVDLTMTAAGNLCGVDCKDGSFTFDGWASEHVKVATAALGTTSGDTVSANNMGSASAMIQFGGLKTLSAPPAPNN
jgi:hypothetical protein